MSSLNKPLAGALSVLASCLSVQAPFVLAQETNHQLNRLVVVGNRTPSQISEVPGTVWVVEQEALQEQVRSGRTLKEALGDLIPGLDAGSQGRTNYGQKLRGRSVLVMIDGVSLNSARGVSRQFDSIDPFNIERVEVLSGATAVYGGGATGGIINIVTKKAEAGEPTFETQVGATSGFEGGDDLDLRAAQSIQGGTETLHGRLGIAVEKNGGFFDAEGEQIKPDIAQTDLQYNRSIDVTGSVGFKISDLQRIDLLAQFYDSRFDGDRGLYLGEDFSAVRGTDPYAFAVREGLETDQEPATERYLVNLNYQHLDVFGHTAYLQAYARGEDLSFHPFPYLVLNDARELQPGSYYSASEQTTDVVGAKLLLVKEFDRFEFSYGLDVDRETFDSTQTLFDFATAAETGGLVSRTQAVVGRYPDIQIDTGAVFLQAEWQASDWLRLNAGIRQQVSNVEVDDFVDKDQQVLIAQGFGASAEAVPGGEKSYNVTLGNVGAIFDLTDDQQAWTNFSQGYEIPDPAKYYGQGTYTQVGDEYELVEGVTVEDSPLQGIKTHQVELGWRHAAGGWSNQVAAYYAWSDKAVGFDRDDLSVVINDEKVRDYGIEASTAYRFSEHWQIGGTGHFTRSEIEADGSWEKRDVRYASPSKLTAFLGWGRTDTHLRLQGQHILDLEDDSGRELEGYTLVDLLGSHRLPVGELSFGIANLLDNDYTTVWGQRAQAFYGGYYGPDEMFDYKGRGRTYSLAYTVQY